eukprot:3823916-Rhodomonas_salina.6
MPRRRPSARRPTGHNSSTPGAELCGVEQVKTEICGDMRSRLNAATAVCGVVQRSQTSSSAKVTMVESMSKNFIAIT